MSTALISVSNKLHLERIIKCLHEKQTKIYATSGTKSFLDSYKIGVHSIEEISGWPELLGGRVKTLDPKIFAGILARDSEQDFNELKKAQIQHFDLIICNLYPFKETYTNNEFKLTDQCIESIDIGGVSLIRAAAKNHQRVLVVCDPNDYDEVISAIELSNSVKTTATFRQKYASKAFRLIEEYDRSIALAYAKEFSTSQHFIPLRYGMNPHHSNASISMPNMKPLPLKVVNGSLSYINVCDALNGWQLVKSLKQAIGIPAATCFKHVSPAGAAVGTKLNAMEIKSFMVNEEMVPQLSELALAFIRARNGDSLSAFGDFIALSDVCDKVTAQLIAKEVSDGIIAPGYSLDALEILKKKKNGKYCVLEIDQNYEPELSENRTIYGINLIQDRNNYTVSEEELKGNLMIGNDLTKQDIIDIIVGTITLKYTQSNSVCFSKNGQIIGIAAGQQSRLHATKLARDKAQNWWLRQQNEVLNLPFKSSLKRFDKNNAIDYFLSNMINKDNWMSGFHRLPSEFSNELRQKLLNTLNGVSYVSDAFLPFSDNIEVANQCNIRNVAAPMGSLNDDNILKKCSELNLNLIKLNCRLFHH